MAPIERVTLFKIPKEEDIDRLLDQYRTLSKTAVKVSKLLYFQYSFCQFSLCLSLYIIYRCTCPDRQYRMASPISPALPWASRTPTFGIKDSTSRSRLRLRRWMT